MPKYNVGDILVSIDLPARYWLIKGTNGVTKVYNIAYYGREIPGPVSSCRFEGLVPMGGVDSDDTIKLYIHSVSNPVTASEHHKCKCAMRDLMMNGCRCGGV